MILGLRREVDENFALLGCYAASGGNFTPEDGTDGLSRNVGNKLPLLAAS